MVLELRSHLGDNFKALQVIHNKRTKRDGKGCGMSVDKFTVSIFWIGMMDSGYQHVSDFLLWLMI
jgi:hypothetical protein